jgi:hypothetical protein
MPREFREAISEHEMLMGDLLEKAEQDREQFELESCKLAGAMRKGAGIAFTRAAEECLDAGHPELAKRFYFLANRVLRGPLNEVEND